jgi:PPOX class probable F420-dependent enzyme
VECEPSNREPGTLPPQNDGTGVPNDTVHQMARPVATTTDVDRAGLEAFIRPRHQAVISTRRGDGTTQMSPVTMGVDPDGTILIATYPERAKARNLRLRPEASVCVLSDSFNGPWVQVSGIATVVDIPEALDGLVTYFRSISGEHPDWDEYRRAMFEQQKALIRIVPDRWGPISQGGFPSRLVG